MGAIHGNHWKPMESQGGLVSPKSFFEACKVSLSNGFYWSRFTKERTSFFPDSCASLSG